MAGRQRRQPALINAAGRIIAARPTLRGASFLVIGVLCLIAAAQWSSSELLFLGLVLTILPLATMMILAFRRPRVTVSRSLGPHVVAAGGTTDVSLQLDNLSGRELGATAWRDMVPAVLGAQGPRPLPSRAGRRITLDHTVHVDRRGVYPIGPLVLQQRDPFGLAFGEKAFGSSRDLIVTPAIIDLPGALMDIASSDGMARAALLRSSPSADELMARDYRPGDPLRRVHWGATARHGELMVRQEEQRSNPEAWIVFDTVTDVLPMEPSHAFEQAVALVASLGIHLLDEGFTVGLVCTGGDQLSARSGERRGGGGSAPTFQLPAGDQHLLRGLAEIEQSVAGNGDAESSTLQLLDGMHLAGKEATVFGVFVDGQEGMLQSVAAVRSPTKPALAFLSGASAERAGTLVNAGWLCVPLSDDDDDLSAAWDSATAALGARDG